jgi:predicted nucleic acid-binding protein
MVKIAYVDTSILVKHYVEGEESSAYASHLITDHRVYVSVIAQVEMLSALARKHQMKEIPGEEMKRIKNAFLSDCRRMGFIEVSDGVIKEAQNLVFKSSIKTLDAIHLASSIILRGILETPFPLITVDKKLGSAAKAEGFEVIGIE